MQNNNPGFRVGDTRHGGRLYAGFVRKDRGAWEGPRTMKRGRRMFSLKHIVRIMLVVLPLALTGCSTSKEEMLPSGDSTMLELWNDGASATHATSESRTTLRRPVTDSEREINQQVRDSYSRTQENEIQQTFPRLPNPDMVMYVFPHLTGGNTPVPGYSTVFSFYSQVQYALPGERTEDL